MATAIEKNTARLMMKKLQGKLDSLFEEQQAMNGNKGSAMPQQQFKKGGIFQRKIAPNVDNRLSYNDMARSLVPKAEYGGYADGVFNRFLPKAPDGSQVPWNYNPYNIPQDMLKTSPNLYNGDNGYNINHTFFNLNDTHGLGYSDEGVVIADKQLIPYKNSLSNPTYRMPTDVYSQGSGKSGPNNNIYNGGTLPNVTVTANNPQAVSAATAVTKGGTNATAGQVAAKPAWSPPQNIGYLNQHLSDITSNAKFGNLGGDFGKPAQVGDNKLVKEHLSAGTPAAGFDWGKAGNFAAQMAPVLYNLGMGIKGSSKASGKYNPYEGQIMSELSNRHFNIDPMLNADAAANAIYNRNVMNAGNSRGEIMSNLTAGENTHMGADANAWAQKNNMENQYASEKANMMYNLGQNRASMDWQTQDYNLRNKAASDQFTGMGLNDLSQWAQMQERMKNEGKHDDMLRGVFKDQYGNSPIGGYMPNIMDIINYMNNNKTK